MQTAPITIRQRTELTANTDTSWLKLVALCFMMIDHLGVVMYPGIPELRMLGRIAMPVYVWCLVVGCEYTHDIYRYALRLLVLAIISQPINMVALGNSWSKFNILFLLFLGVASITAIKEKKFGSQFWVPAFCYLLLGFLKVDYGWKGLTFILMMYAARKSRAGLGALFLAYAMFWGTSNSQIQSIFGMPLDFLTWPAIGQVTQPFFRVQAMMWMALPFILIPTHTGIKLPKWLSYGFYPLHLLVIIALRLLSGVDPSMMFGVLGKF